MTNASFQPRPSQARILEYTGGRMGVSAVPGSGKTTTLSALAAKLVREAAAGHGGHAHPSAGVFQNAGLTGSWLKDRIGHKQVR